jgi:hypothetical protein
MGKIGREFKDSKKNTLAWVKTQARVFYILL